jgi:hypothetical protein
MTSRQLDIAAILACLTLTALLGIQGAPLITAQAPHAILSFEFAATPARATQMIAAWSPAQIEAARINLLVDLLYLVSYPLAISRVIRMLGGSALIARLVWIAAPCDLIENISLWRALDGELGGVGLAAACATIKFAMVALGLGAILVAALLRARGSAARPPAA